ncbi:MAG: peptidase M61 domain-containing protein [Stygiobacter sp.]|nr:MAG: peptidase M61 domain-containing protein [Stygiobacter sp.]KAF0213725.1 MAG: peptidase M61 domain-containing [Ignavibacteria bacterium]
MRKLNYVFLVMISILSISSAQQKFFVNLNDRADDLFKVTLVPSGLTSENKIFQFASTAPGTYQTMDIGRFVRSFKAFDESGSEIECKQVQTNQWEISEPAKTKKIVYTIAETWDTPVKTNNVYAMSGTSLESDHAVINGQAVFGYFHGKQKDAIEIKIDYPADWNIGTALHLNSEGFYRAKNYDEVVDSPIMLGKLTKTSTKIENTNIDIYSYSKTGKITAESLLLILEDMLNATSQFTEGLPVDNYTFLFHFENFSAGAWEHNYSSFYVFAESDLSDYLTQELKSVAAHEFYHVVTPLNIHSELVGNFNFEKPTMSQHIWLYEGVTEWASDILQLRDYLITLDEYCKQIKGKLSANDNFDQSISLTELSLHSTEKQDQYPNIYQKGALVAGLLDIRLLQLSSGKKGLREVINQLYKDYGTNKAFSEKDFFDELVKRTYPEIGDFINRYIKGTEKLPVAEYYGWLGIDYKEYVGVDSSKISIGFGIGVKDGKFIITRVDNPTADGAAAGDFVLKVNGEEVTMQNAQAKFAFMSKMKVGESFDITVDRKGEQKEVKVYMQPRPIKHEFKVLDNATEAQLALRSAWMQNL